MRGKGNKLGEGEGSKLGEPSPKVRLSQDRLPIEPFAYFAQMSFAQMSLNLNKHEKIFRYKHTSLFHWGYNDKRKNIL